MSYDFGLEHGDQLGPPPPDGSRLHSNDAPGSPLNDHTGSSGAGEAGVLVSTGPAGGSVSSVYPLVAVWPTLPAASLARTENVYAPSGSPVRSYSALGPHGVQGSTSVPPRSSRHSSVAPPSPVNAHTSVRLSSGVAGAVSMLGAAGSVVSSVKSSMAPGPVLPAVSVARTENRYGPSG